jgi:uncharacterized protein (TIGR02217 family)
MSFINSRLAETYNVGSTSDRFYDTEVSETLVNRYTSLRHPYVGSRHTLRYDGRSIAVQNAAVRAMFDAAAGTTHTFRHKDHSDYSTNAYVGTPTSHDQLCVEISSVAKTYQITQWFIAAPDATSSRRKLLLPRSGTVVVAKKNGVTWTELTETTHYTVNYSTGVITLVTALGVGDTLYAGCEFDIPVKFETNLEGVDWSDSVILSSQINLIEVRALDD